MPFLPSVMAVPRLFGRGLQEPRRKGKRHIAPVQPVDEAARYLQGLEQVSVIVFIKDHGGMFGLLGLVVAIMALLYPLRRDSITDKARELCDPELRSDILGKRNQSIGTAYFAALDWLNTRADKFYGDGLLTLRAFDRCLKLALLYPIFGVFLAWVAFDLHNPGGFVLFQSDPSLFNRVWKAGLLVSALGALGYTWAQMNRIEERFSAFSTIWVVSWVVSGAVIGVGIVVVTVVAIFVGVGVGVVVGIVGIVVVVGIIVGNGVVGVASTGVAVAGVISVGVVNAGIVGDIEAAAEFAFFYLFLPFTNAFADLLSVALTRSFLRWAANKKPGLLAVFVAFVFDVIWGLLCLFGLLYLLTLGLDLWQSLSPATVPLDWRVYWAEVRADPRQGLALWLMALTTLLPTLIHVVVGLTAMLTHASRRRIEALDELEEVCGTDSFTEARQHVIATKLVNADTYAMCLGSLFLLIAIYALWQVSEWVLPYLSNWHLLFPS